MLLFHKLAQTHYNTFANWQQLKHGQKNPSNWKETRALEYFVLFSIFFSQLKRNLQKRAYKSPGTFHRLSETFHFQLNDFKLLSPFFRLKLLGQVVSARICLTQIQFVGLFCHKNVSFPSLRILKNLFNFFGNRFPCLNILTLWFYFQGWNKYILA